MGKFDGKYLMTGNDNLEACLKSMGLPEEDIRTYLAPTATNCFIMRERETEFEMVTDCKDLPQWNQTTICKLGVREEHTIPVTQFITLTKESDNSWLMKIEVGGLLHNMKFTFTEGAMKIDGVIGDIVYTEDFKKIE